MPSCGLKTPFPPTGAEGQSQGSSERAGRDPVPLHAVARHGRARVRPAGPDLREEVLGRPDAGHGPRAGALQVGPPGSPPAWVGRARGVGLVNLAAVALPLFCLMQRD